MLKRYALTACLFAFFSLPPTILLAQPGGGKMTSKLIIQSKAFEAGKRIPLQHTGDGKDTSPELSWTGIPPDTKELALIVDDPDAPQPKPWVHWVIYKIPASVSHLPEGIKAFPTTAEVPGAMQGKNSWGTFGYRGPLPPPGHGTHHYHFKLYALASELNVKPGLTKDELLSAMKGHILQTESLLGTYER